MALLAGTVGVALLLAVVAPAIGARVAEHRAIAHLAAIGPLSRSAERVARDNELVTHALGEVAVFDRGRRSATTMLAAMAKALPDGAVLLAFHLDSVGGSVVLLAPRAGVLLTRLEGVPAVTAPDIIGPVTRETVGGHEVERMTVRFRWSRQ